MTIVDDNIHKAWDFDGESDFLSVPDSPSLNFTNEVTLAWRVYPRQFNHGQWWWNFSTIVTKNLAYYMNLNASWSPQFYRYGLSNPWYHTASVTLPLNQRSHVTSTYDWANVRIYVDGIEVYVSPATGSWDLSTIGVGMWRNPSETFSVRDLDGRLDDIRIYNRALSEAEILDLLLITNNECMLRWGISGDGCSDQCEIEYCRDDAPLNDTSKNFVVTDLDASIIAWTSNQANSKVAICYEDTTWTRDVFFTMTDNTWSFTYTPTLAPYAPDRVNVGIMLHDENNLDIDHHALMITK